MSVETDAQHLQINAAVRRDEFFVIRAFNLQIVRHAVRQVRVAWINVHGVKKTPPHEAVIRTRIVCRQPDIFIEIKCPAA